MTDVDHSFVEHPSPHRATTSVGGLLYGLMAAPLAWATEQLANSALAQEACFPLTRPLVAPEFHGLVAYQSAVVVLSLIVSASGAFVAWRAWQATRKERPGNHHELLAIGEGRSRFMAFAGLLTSIGAIVATLFSVIALLLVPAC